MIPYAAIILFHGYLCQHSLHYQALLTQE